MKSTSVRSALNCLFHVLLHLYLLTAGKCQRPGADMAGHAQGQGIHVDIIAGELLQNLVLVSFSSLLIGCVGDLQPDVLILCHTPETVLNILFDSTDHNGFALVGGAGLGKGVQLLPLDLQHGL